MYVLVYYVSHMYQEVLYGTQTAWYMYVYVVQYIIEIVK